MKKLIGIICMLYCLGIISCAPDSNKSDAVITPAKEVPAQVQKKNTVATPSDISRPTVMRNNFQRIQGEWRSEADFNQRLTIRGKSYVEITDTDKGESQVAQQFKMVEACDGAINLDGTYLKIGRNRCFKINKVEVETLELEDVEQQNVMVFKRI